MRRFLTALIVVSILGMAQSVVANTPVPSSTSLQIEWLEATAGSEAAASLNASPIEGEPAPLHMFLMLTGLFGLLAAGGRPPRVPEPASRR